MKKIGNSPAGLIGLIILLLTSSISFGQTEEQKAKFEEERIAYFTKELQLNDAEAEKFWPAYNDFNNRKMKIAEEEKSILSYFYKNSENMSDQEISKSLSDLLEINKQRNKLEIDYQNKFMEILPERKVLLLYVVERQFRRHIIERIRHHDQGPGSGQGQRQGQGGGNSKDGRGYEPGDPDNNPIPAPSPIPN